MDVEALEETGLAGMKDRRRRCKLAEVFYGKTIAIDEKDWAELQAARERGIESRFGQFCDCGHNGGEREADSGEFGEGGVASEACRRGRLDPGG